MILVAGWIATDIWRWIGVFAGGKLREDGELLIWVRCVATALVAGVIARLILFPSGALAEMPMWLRAASAIIGFAVFSITGQKVVYGVLSGVIVLIAGWFLIGGV
ncbi:MAG: AzlD domain-containing protein [Rhodobacteraceae bacterium]|nr:AzlD domain-containing protein [Paracoccaceae bacterium]